MKRVSAEHIATDFGFQIAGDAARETDHLGSLKRRSETGLFWAKNARYLADFDCGVVICSTADFDAIKPHKQVTYLKVAENPRLQYSKVAATLMEDDVLDNLKNYVEEHRNNPNIFIADNVFIGKGVTIGDGTIIHPNVCLYSGTRIGKHCVVQSNASLSTEGLGLEFDEETGRYFKFPQIGGVVLGDYVEIGPNTTIRKSALDDTIVGDGTMIGALCNVGHNCIIGKNCILTCNVVTSGSSVIGDKVYLGVSSTIKQGVNVGSNATVGQGAVVVKDVPAGETWVGNPAKQLKKT